MAIAFDASSTGSALPGSSVTGDHTSTGSNRVGVVGVHTEAATPGITISGVTWDSAAMTLVDSQSWVNGGNTEFQYYFYILNQGSGAKSVVVTASGSGNIRVSRDSYTGAKQSGNFSNFTKETSTTSPKTTSLTVAEAASWLVGNHADNQGSGAAGTGTTQRAALDADRFNMDSGSPPGVGSQSLETTYAGGGTVGHIIAEMLAADSVIASRSLRGMGT